MVELVLLLPLIRLIVLGLAGLWFVNRVNRIAADLHKLVELQTKPDAREAPAPAVSKSGQGSDKAPTPDRSPTAVLSDISKVGLLKKQS